jgi:hypothetical protein
MANTKIVSGASVQVTGTLDMRGNRVTGLETNLLAYPLQPSDGATKAYVDATRQQIESALPALADNGAY